MRVLKIYEKYIGKSMNLANFNVNLACPSSIVSLKKSLECQILSKVT